MECHPGTICQGSLAKGVKPEQAEKGRRAQSRESEAKQEDNSMHKERCMIC